MIKKIQILQKLIKISNPLCFGVLILLMLTAGCVGERLLPDELTLTISIAEWYLEHEPNGFDSIMLRIKGSTNGERVTIIVYGAGVPCELELALDENKHFNQALAIRFTYGRYTPPEQAETTVKAFRGSEFTEVKLQNGNIW